MHAVHRTPRARVHRRAASALLAAGFTVIAGVVAAENAGPAASSARPADIDLPALFAAAWQRQPEARSLAAREEAARAHRAIANRWTADAPAVEVMSRSDRLHRNDGAREHEVGLAVPLWLAGERAGVRSLAEAEAQGVASRLAAARLRTSAAVREAYWSWQRARIDVALAAERVANARALAADVARRLQAGDVARADAHQAQASVAAAAGELAESMRVLVAAQESVRALTGLVLPDAEPDLDRDASTSLAGNRPEPLPALPAQAGDFDASHPAVADLSAQADVAGRTLDLARTQTRAHPEVLVAATRERGEFGEPHRDTVTLGIRIPLGADARYRARVASASAEALELEGRMRLERERIVAAVAAARRHVDLSKMRLDAALERERLARETRGFHQRSFSAGETDLPTRLRIELDAAEAARQAGRARIDHAHAVSSLRQALGLLPE